MSIQSKKLVKLKNGFVFGNGHIYIQSMLNRPAADISGNVEQAVALEKAGCEILRVAIPNKEAISLIPAIKNKINIPLVADIHFDYRLALESIAAGIDKIRINPGNIGDEERVRQVAKSCALAGIPIRIGVNSGSVEKELLQKYKTASAEAMVQSALGHVRLLEKYDFDDIVISIKSSDVRTMIDAYRRLSSVTDYPLHLGVTEAGTPRMGLIKSAVGIGSLLADGIGDTIRVSLTGEPIEEIRAAKDILQAVGLCNDRVSLISCPTCGRTQIDLIALANKVEKTLENVRKPYKIAVMGCAVNGPGEAKDADLGIAGGDGCAILFKKGKIIKKLPESEILEALLDAVKELDSEHEE